MAGENLDLTSEVGRSAKKNPNAKERPFLGVHFECCDIYTRIYLNPEETAYDGKCPRCFKKVTMKVGSGGTSERFFTAR